MHSYTSGDENEVKDIQRERERERDRERQRERDREGERERDRVMCSINRSTSVDSPTKKAEVDHRVIDTESAARQTLTFHIR